MNADMKCRWGIEGVNGEMPGSEFDMVINSPLFFSVSERGGLGGWGRGYETKGNPQRS
jgi:hypothetical protein